MKKMWKAVLSVWLMAAFGCALQQEADQAQHSGAVIQNATFDREILLPVMEEKGQLVVVLEQDATNIPYMLVDALERGNLVVIRDISGRAVSTAKMVYNEFEQQWQSANLYLAQGTNYIEYPQDTVAAAPEAGFEQGVTVSQISWNNSVVENIASGGWKVFQKYEGTGSSPATVLRDEKYNLWFDFTVINPDAIDNIWVNITEGPAAVIGVYQAYRDSYQDIAGKVKYSVDITGGAAYKNQVNSTVTRTPAIKYFVRVVYKNFSFATTPTMTYDLISDVDQKTYVRWVNANSSCNYDYMGVTADNTKQVFLETRKSDNFKTVKQVACAEVTHNYLDGYWKKAMLFTASDPFFAARRNDTHKKVPGLWWVKQPNGAYFDTSKPIIIFCHGASGSSSTVSSTEWNLSQFTQDFNVAAFDWSDFNYPDAAINGYWEGGVWKSSKASQLQSNLAAVLEYAKYNNNEIRFVGFSWGVFPASFGAKKTLSYVRSKGLNVLVTLDATEPVPHDQWLTDDENSGYNWGSSWVLSYYQYVRNNQVASLKSGTKMFEAVYCNGAASWSYDFKTKVAPNVSGMNTIEASWNYYWNDTYNHSTGYGLYIYNRFKNYRVTRFQP